ncbi:MAG: hypothetical protein WCK05_02550 [Planctomycetota bacterium]
MSDERENTNERLEGLLRRWGAQEAAGRSAPGAFVPGWRGGMRPTGGWLWRWAPAMAAAVMLVAAVGVYVMSGEKVREVSVARPAVPVPPVPSDAGEIAKLKAELAQAKTAGQQSARELGAKGKALAEAAVAAEGGKGQLVEAAKRLEEAKAALEDSRRKAEALQLRLAAAETEKAKVDEQLKGAQAAGEAQAVRLKKVQQALTEETAQLRQMHADAVAGESKAKTELQRGRASQAIVLAAARKAYVESVGGQRAGAGRVEVMQAVARARRMLSRKPDAAELPRAGKLSDAVGVLDGLFTRLDLVDANNPAECRKFMDLLRDKHVSEQVEQALAITDSDTIRGWLVEASLILGGGDNAG